jgi:FKBP-type peptidyl-prolyl cis-trans isomerase FklB
MKSYLNICLIGLVVYALTTGCKDGNSGGSVTLKSKSDTVSYIIGTSIGANFKQNGLEINNDVLIKGIEAGQKGTKPIISEEVVKRVMSNLQKDVMAKQQLRMKDEAVKNKKAGDQFLAENKKYDGVITLPDGLQYKIIKKGNGPMPKATDKVTVNYEGTTIDGKVFDSSYERKQPASFPVSQVIKGWSEALQLMPVGSTWQLFIPSDLAYGERGQQNIPAGSTLIFKVELLSIDKADAADLSQKPKAKK